MTLSRSDAEIAYVTAFAGLVAAKAQGERTAGSAVKIPGAAGLITEMVFLDDCVRLAMYDPEISKDRQDRAHYTLPDYVGTGRFLRPVRILSPRKDTHSAVGRCCSEALHLHRQPNSAEARLYPGHRRYARSQAAKAGHNPAKPSPVGDLLDVLHVRRRLGLHTLNPDDDIQNWLEGS